MITNKKKRVLTTLTTLSFTAFLASFLAAITIIGILAIPAIWIGYIESLLRIRRGGKVDFGAFFKVGFKQWWPLFVLVLLMFLGILAGLMLLIIP